MIKKLLNYIDDFTYNLTYEKNEININQSQFLKEYDNGLSFIDYLYEFYFVRDLFDYNYSYGTKREKSVNSEIKKSDITYYYGLLFIKWLLIELKKSLNEINDFENMGVEVFYLHLEDRILISIDYDYDYKFFSVPNSLEKLIKISRVIPDRVSKVILIYIIMRKLLNKEIDWDEVRLDSFLEIMQNDLKDLLKEFRDFVSLNYFDDNMFKIYTNNKVSDWLKKIIKNSQIISELEQLSGRKKNKLNCYAEAVVNESKYYSINGLDGDDYDSIHRIFEKLRCQNYRSVFISNGVRYFLPDEIEYITYKQFFENKTPSKENRMFTCCERKLFAEIRRQKNIDHDIKIVVSSPPCVYCSREIRNIEKNYKNKIEKVYQKNGDLEKESPNKQIVLQQDKVAEKIWKKNN